VQASQITSPGGFPDSDKRALIEIGSFQLFYLQTATVSSKPLDVELSFNTFST
jgi:hypothetical protein